MLWTAFVIGLAGSLHCLGMCGPIVWMLPLNRKARSTAFFQTVLYHLGRLSAYSLIGLLFGSIGRGLYLAGFQQRLSVLIGVLMIIAILMPASLLGKLPVSKGMYKLFGKLKQALGTYLHKRSTKAFFSIGFLNGFLPCGLVYMALIGAVAAGSLSSGALYMAFFGLGTIPLMAFALFLKRGIAPYFRSKIQKIIPVFIVMIGILFILRGLGIGIPFVSPSDAKLQLSNDPATCITIEKND
ncbi:MAG: sulfite exporter TauE/SafE family protein [Lutibacter sp.]|jgi:hypothetical protein|nr:sulfite exporter TauE/SafE family protein [Lutibacter sp.]